MYVKYLSKKYIFQFLHPLGIYFFLHSSGSKLKLGSLLQEGTFGKVYQGRYSNDITEDEEEDVVIKTVMSWSSTTQSELLVIEAVKLSGLNHNHILTPWCMTWDGSSPMFIYPYSSQGNLKQYLTILAKAGLSTHQIVKYGIQLLSAIGKKHTQKKHDQFSF